MQWNDKYDKLYFNKQVGMSIKVLEFGKPFDLGDCEIDSNARTCRNAEHDEVWALMQRDAKQAGLSQPRSDIVSIKDRYPAEWSPIEIKGKGIRVKYEHIRGGNDQFKEYNNRRKFGIINPVSDRTFLLDRKNIVFAEFDSEHLRQRGDERRSAESLPAPQPANRIGSFDGEGVGGMRSKFGQKNQGSEEAGSESRFAPGGILLPLP